MKKILLVLTVFLVGLIFIGCGKESAEVDLSAPVTLVLWTHEDPNRSVLEKELIAEFTAANPNVSVDYQTYPSGKMQELLTIAFSANQGPDLFNQSQALISSLVVAGRTAAVDPTWIGAENNEEILSRYIDGALEAVYWQGGIHGLPLEYTNLCMYLNKKIFREAGLNPETDYPKTWEDVMAVSEKIVQRNGQILLRRGFDFRYPSYTQQFIPMVEQLGGKLVSDDGKTGVIGDEAWLQFFEYMREWGPHGKDLGGPTYTAARSVFDLDNNEIAMSESGLYQQSRMNSVNPDFYNSDDWMVIPYPQWSNATQVSNGKIAAHYYVVNGQSAEAKQIWAWKLISFMLSHSEDYLEQVNLVQPTYELFESEAFKNIPYSDVFAKDLENATLTYFGSGSTAMNDKLKSAVEDVMLQGKDPKTVLESFRKDIQEIIDDI